MESKDCAITRHCPMWFAWKYNENDARCEQLKGIMREQFALLYKQGVRRINGMPLSEIVQI